MKLIVGLGNPGREYEATRHNVGWWVVDHLAGVWRFDGWKHDADTLVASGRVGDTTVRLVKPLTYMNLSGAVLRPYLRRTGWEFARDLLVVVDEVALPVGRIRMRASGSAGGHNGLKSIEAALDSREYARLRVGVGASERPEGSRLSDFVLSRPSKSDRDAVLSLLPEITLAAETWARNGVAAAMNTFNRITPPASE